MTQEQEELFKADPFVKHLLEFSDKYSETILIGGAVVDILEKRPVKDYDLMGYIDVDKLSLEYAFETKTAKTYKKGEFIVQILKTKEEDFDFKISQTKLRIKNNNLSLFINSHSFDKKLLIPTDKAWTEKRNAVNSLRRIIHWKNKGYSINDTTYLSLLNVVGKSEYKNS